MQAYSVPATDAAEISRTRLIALSGNANVNSSHVVEVKNGQIIIPQQLLTEMGVKEGETMEMSVIGSTLTIRPAKFCTSTDEAILDQLIHEGVLIGA
ncbi:MAG: AbrB/MazE/SpoVT family DNA-binding domain-containing protein [Methylocystaceae bacterium]